MTKFKLCGIILSVVLLISMTEGYLEVKNRLEAPPKAEENIITKSKPRLISKVSARGSEVEVVEEKEIKTKNILLLGSDTRVKDKISRSDAIMVLQLKPDTREINYISIPRDAYVDIIGKGYKDKINHAMAYGVNYSVDTIENLLGLEIDNHFVIDFFSFEKVIDDLGGIQVDVPFTFTEQNSKGKRNAVKITKGRNTLNGEESLAYARMRKQDNEGDTGRAKRQQQIIESVMERFSDTTNYEKIKVMKTIMNEVSTDLELKDVVNYVDYLYNYTKVNKIVLSGEGTKIDGVYYMLLDKSLEDAKNLLNNTHSEYGVEENNNTDTVIDNKTHLQ